VRMPEMDEILILRDLFNQWSSFSRSAGAPSKLPSNAGTFADVSYGICFWPRFFTCTCKWVRISYSPHYRYPFFRSFEPGTGRSWTSGAAIRRSMIAISTFVHETKMQELSLKLESKGWSKSEDTIEHFRFSL
jgi:hypothetical protein